MTHVRADLMVEGATVITMDRQRRVIDDGAVAVRDGRIVDVDERARVAARFPQVARRLDGRGRLVIPGIVDAHAHAGHSLVKTLGYGRPGAWEAALMRIYAEASSAGFWRADADLAALERLKGGVTCGLSILGGYVIRTDEPEYAAVHCEAHVAAGIRSVLALGPCPPPHPQRFVRWSGGSSQALTVDLARQIDTCLAVADRWHGAASGRIRICLLSPLYWPGRAGATEDLRAEFMKQMHAVRALSRERGLWFTQDGHQRGTVAAIAAEGMLGPDALLSHCVDITADEVAMLAEAGAHVVHNPGANASLLGRCPVPELRAAGVTVAIGSDAAAPDRSFDMFRHMLEGMRTHRRFARDISVLPPGEALAMITIDAARALGLEEEIGSIEVGKQADLAVVDMRKPHLAPANMPLHRLAHYATAADVDTVVVAGRVCMEGRQPVGIDQEAVIDAAERETALALERAGLGHLTAAEPGCWGPAFEPPGAGGR